MEPHNAVLAENSCAVNGINGNESEDTVRADEA